MEVSVFTAANTVAYNAEAYITVVRGFIAWAPHEILFETSDKVLIHSVL